MNLTDLAQALEANNVGVGAGVVDRGGEGLAVRSDARIRNIGELASTVIATREGTPIRLDSVAQVRSLVASAERTVSERSPVHSGDPRMSYIIRVSDQGRERELRFHDDNLCPEAEDLIAWVKQHS